MKRELDYFTVDGKPGGNQRWFWDPVLRIGGCAALCACDSCIALARANGLTELYPYDAACVTRREYKKFAKQMKHYLHPGFQGVPKLELFTAGLGNYLADQGEKRLRMTEFSGLEPVATAAEVIRAEIDAGFPIPCMMLRHENPAMKEYVWHWFLLTGWADEEDGFCVQATTYSASEWLSLDTLWNTGCEERGGLILYHLAE